MSCDYCGDTLVTSTALAEYLRHVRGIAVTVEDIVAAKRALTSAMVVSAVRKGRERVFVDGVEIVLSGRSVVTVRVDQSVLRRGLEELARRNSAAPLGEQNDA